MPRMPASTRTVEEPQNSNPEQQPVNPTPPTMPERKVEQLNPIRMKEAEYARPVFVATAHANTQPDDLLDPAYWSHTSTQLKPWAKIEARADDGTWFAEYLVLEAGRNWAKVHMLSKHNLTSNDVAMSQAAIGSPYEVVFRGPHELWSVVRKADRQVVHSGSGTKGGAVDWLEDRLKAGEA